MSEDFNYSTVRQTMSHPRFESLEYPVKGLKEKQGLRIAINRMQLNFIDKIDVLRNIHDSIVKDGFSLLIHDSFEVPSNDSVHVQTVTGQFIRFFVTPEMIQIEESLKEFERNEKANRKYSSSCY